MIQRGREITFEERIEIGERWEAGQTDPKIAAARGRRVPTVRKWRRKYQREGRSALVFHRGRPRIGALGQFPREVRDAVREVRNRCPGWGPVPIRTELGDDRRFDGMKLVSSQCLGAVFTTETRRAPSFLFFLRVLCVSVVSITETPWFPLLIEKILTEEA